MQGNGIAKIDARENGEDVGLNECDTDLERVHGNRERERQPADQGTSGEG